MSSRSFDEFLFASLQNEVYSWKKEYDPREANSFTYWYMERGVKMKKAGLLPLKVYQLPYEIIPVNILKIGNVSET